LAFVFGRGMMMRGKRMMRKGRRKRWEKLGWKKRK
jgi:hypothetical protein